MKNKKSQFIDNTKLKNIIFYIFAFVIFFVPLIVKLKVFTVPDYVSTYYPTGKTFDFFTYYKAMLLIVGVSILFPLVVYYRYKARKKIKFDLVAKLHLAFGASILLSTLLSSYKQVAFLGFFNKNEGALTWWAYLLLSYSIYLFVESREEVTKFIRVIVASTTAISVIGVFQFIGLDYIKFDWIQKLVYGPYYEQISKSGVQLIFSDKTIYSTVANPNYIGSVMALAIPLILYLFLESKNKKEKVVANVLLLLHLFVLVASKSTAGLLAVGITMVGYYIYWLVEKNQFKLLVSGTMAIALIIGAVSYSGLIDAQILKVKSIMNINQVVANPYKKIEINGTRIKFVDQTKNYIIVNHNEEMLWIEDEKNNIISGRLDANNVLYQDDLWKVSYDTQVSILSVHYYSKEMGRDFIKQVGLTKTGYTIFGADLTNKQLETKTINLFKNEFVFTERGYIWNRAIPLIFKKPILGYGADNFVLEFPQNDLLNKPRYNQLTDKPHNLILQIAINYGLVGLLILVYMFYICLKGKQRIILKLSMLAYIIAGIANDNTVFTGVLFLSVLGLLISNLPETTT